LKQYVHEEYYDKKGLALDISKWSGKVMTTLPQQTNGSDCGVFVCKYADYVTRRAPNNIQAI
jgi:sentrin-specific protease 1